MAKQRLSIKLLLLLRLLINIIEKASFKQITKIQEIYFYVGNMGDMLLRMKSGTQVISMDKKNLQVMHLTWKVLLSGHCKLQTINIKDLLKFRTFKKMILPEGRCPVPTLDGFIVWVYIVKFLKALGYVFFFLLQL